MEQEYYQIKEAAKAVHVESHVLRYWEEELGMPIQRNDKGHRLYSKEDVNRFIKVKKLKEEGLQLKAVKKILQDEGLKCVSFKVRNIEDYAKMNTPDKVSQIVKSTLETEDQEDSAIYDLEEENPGLEHLKQENTDIEQDNRKHENEIQFIPRMKIEIKDAKEEKNDLKQYSQALENQDQQDKILRMQTLIKKFISDTVVETHEMLKDSIQQDIKESIAKEMDYQFRCHAEVEEAYEKSRVEREKNRIVALQEKEEAWELERRKREEAHFKAIDELLRKAVHEKRFGKK